MTALALATANASVAIQSSVVAICVAKVVALLCLGFFTLILQYQQTYHARLS
jgi:hypothetical protein